MSTEEPSSLSPVETSSSSQRTESDVQTSRTIHINEEKSTNENNDSIPVQCQPGPDYHFPTKQFGKKKRSCQASWFKNFSWLHYSKEKDSIFLARQGLGFIGNDGNDNLTQLFKLLNENDRALLTPLDKEVILSLASINIGIIK